jgi:hypothetical protein
VPGDGDCASFYGVMKLPVAALGPDKKPAIRMQEADGITNLHIRGNFNKPVRRAV